MAVGLEVTRALDRSRPLTFRVVVRGELDLSTAEVLRGHFVRVLDEGAEMVLVDVAEVTFIDGAGLSSMTWAWQECDERGGRLVIDRSSRAVDRLLELTGLIERFRHGYGSDDGDGSIPPLDTSRRWLVVEQRPRSQPVTDAGAP